MRSYPPAERRRRRRKSAPIDRRPEEAFQPSPLLNLAKWPPSLPKLSSEQLVKIMDHFVTVRSTVKNVSASIQRIENFIDSTYQLMDIAQLFVGNDKQKGFTLPPPASGKEKSSENKKSKLPFSDEEIPVIDLPKENGASPSLGQWISKIDPKLLLSLLGSPAVKRLFTQFQENNHHEHPAIASLDDEDHYPSYPSHF